MIIAFLNPNIPPRAVSLLNRINSHPSVNVHALFYSVSQKNRSWSLKSKEYEKILFKYDFLKSFDIGFGINDFHNTFISFDLFKHLNLIKPDIIVIPGWSDISSILALFWGKINNVKVVLRTESTSREKSWRRTVFFPITSLVLRLSDVIIGSSKAAESYANSISLKTPHTTIFSSFDTKTFANKVNLEKNEKNKIKKDLKITQDKCIYFNGQLINRKGINQLLQAFINPQMKHIGLIITGSGILEQKVENISKEYKNIHYFGYITQDKLPKYYAIADIFILPSFEETWGLVIIEALAAGLPIITSKFVGASEIIDNRKGIIISNINKTSISLAIMKMLKNNIRDIGSFNQKYSIKELNYEKIAKQFVKLFKNISRL